MDIEAIRAEFPALAHWTYLNTATYGQMPRRAAAAAMAHFDRRDQFACTDFLSWFDDMDRIRGLAGKLINCQASDVAFVHSASAGLAWLTQGLDWKPGDEILTLDPEFPNQLYQVALEEPFGIKYSAVPWPQFYDAVTPRTRLVLLSTVNYGTGFRPPLEEISKFLRERNVLLYVDGTQSIGALQFDITKIQPDMYCANAYKWLLSPNGAGIVYVSPELRKRLPATTIGWRSDKGYRQPNSLNHGMPVFSDTAEKYEGGMIAFPSIYAMGAVIEMFLELGPVAIEARAMALADSIRAKLRDFGADVNTDRSPIVTAKLPHHDPGLVAKKLGEEKIVVSARQGRLRVSPHFYNNEQDLEVFYKAFSRIVT